MGADRMHQGSAMDADNMHQGNSMGADKMHQGSAMGDRDAGSNRHTFCVRDAGSN